MTRPPTFASTESNVSRRSARSSTTRSRQGTQYEPQNLVQGGSSCGKTPALSVAQRRRFENEQLTIVEFEGLDEETERDMFSRVQMGMTLSSAEKLGAHLGEWPDFIRQMVKRFIDPTPSLVHDEYGKAWMLRSRVAETIYTWRRSRC